MTDNYRIALRRFSDENGTPRGLLLDRRTFHPSLAGSIYEASLSRRCSSPNTLYRYLQFSQALLSWGAESDLDLDARLLSGETISASETERFALWLEHRFRNGRPSINRRSIRTYNGYLSGAEEMIGWFVEHYYERTVPDIPRAIAIDAILQSSHRSWRRVHKANTSEDVSPDISDEDIAKIETFLRNAIRGNSAEPRWVRAYLIWRLAIEFGMRIGEILALRLEDCPTRADPSFRIVRIEDREGAPDPRGVYAPRPKTMGRALAPVISNTAFPRLVIDYQADHRSRKIVGGSGRIVRRPIMSHNYLIVSDEGDPLSTFTAKSIASLISREAGVEFTWHLARHAFFNRAYAAVARISDPTKQAVRLADLVYWGGWKSDDSLNIYNRRTRRERARTALSIWGGSHERWDALA